MKNSNDIFKKHAQAQSNGYYDERFKCEFESETNLQSPFQSEPQKERGGGI